MITSEDRFILATPTKCGTTTLEAVAKRHMRNGDDPDAFRIMDWDSPRRQHRMALPPPVRDEDGLAESYTDGPLDGSVEEWGGVERYLFVRNPFTRYMSIYTYLSAPANYSQWGAKMVQGSEWPGVADNPWDDQEPMTFEAFLFWLAEERDSPFHTRPSFLHGAAYRSPWVWTDSLTMSLDLLTSQPGESEGEVSLLRLESIDGVADVEGSLAWLLREHDLDGEVQIGGIHANRTTGYGESTANDRVAEAEFWGGIKCTVAAHFSEDGLTVKGAREKSTDHCGACAVGVVAEADDLGYMS